MRILVRPSDLVHAFLVSTFLFSFARYYFTDLHGPVPADLLSPSSPSSQPPPSNMATKAERELLPETVRPSHYELFLEPDLPAFTYAGRVDVTVDLKAPTDTIVLNAKHLVVSRAGSHFTPAGSATAAAPVKLAAEPAHNKENDHLTLTFETELAAGSTGTLHLEFTGELNDQMCGWYRSKYNEADGTETYCAVTQFEAVDARRAFPCWDEPEIKATFGVTMRVEAGLVALSNMPDVETRVEDGGKKTVRFEKSPIMSTYLLAFAVGDFKSIEASTKGGVKVRVFMPRPETDSGEFALQTGVKCLEFFGDYYGIEYPLPKMDMLAVPDFAAGAMENWGLVLYRTKYLLFNEATTSAKDKTRLAYVVAHELAHQWFGNLVTMEWWTDLWLNEGFATWAGWLAIDTIYPEFCVWDGFLTEEWALGLKLDALLSSHPIEVPVAKAEEIDSIFDHISYAKGSSVIRMLAQFVGNDFAAGVTHYLKRHQYDNSVTVDLWRALSEKAGGIDVAALMGPWVKQMGYPVVSAERVEGGGGVRVTQRRFLSQGPEAAAQPDNDYLWPVPLTFRTADKPGEVQSFLLRERSAVLPVAAGAAWVKLNVDHSGFYRVQYSAEMLAQLGGAIRAKAVSVSDRMGVIMDVLALAAPSYPSTASALDALTYYDGETEYLVWTLIAGKLSGVASVMYQQPDQLHQNLAQLGRSLFVPLVERLGWEPKAGEGPLDAMFRALAVGAALKYEAEAVVAEARVRFERFRAGDQGAIVADLQHPVFAAIVNGGGEAGLEQVMAVYKETENTGLRTSVLNALSPNDPALARRALEFSLSADVRKQDGFLVVSATAHGRKTRRAAWEFVKEHWATYKEGLEGMLLGRVAALATESLADDSLAEEVRAFFADPKNHVAGIKRQIDQSLEKIGVDAAWVSRDAAAVADWFGAYAANSKK